MEEESEGKDSFINKALLAVEVASNVAEMLTIVIMVDKILGSDFERAGGSQCGTTYLCRIQGVQKGVFPLPWLSSPTSCE